MLACTSLTCRHSNHTCDRCVLRIALHLSRDQVHSSHAREATVRDRKHVRIQEAHATRLRMPLAALDSAQVIDDMDRPGFRLHRITGRGGRTLADHRERQQAEVRVPRRERVRPGPRGLPPIDTLAPLHDPAHPGEFITEIHLTPHNISARELASQLGVSPSTVTRVLTGSSRVSSERALRLAHVLGRSAESWLAKQDAYDLWVAREQVDLSSVAPLRFAS